VEFVVSQNLHRRHLTAGQKAAVAAEIEPMLAKEAKQRQKAHGGTAPGRKKEANTCGKVATSDPPRTRDEAAKITGAKGRYVQDAKKVKEKAPEAFEKVKAGTMTLPQAKRQVEREEKTKELEAKARAAVKKNGKAEQLWQIKVGDCIDELAKVEQGAARLVFADPPYNIGIDYGDGEKEDRVPEMEYLRWCASWFTACYRALAPDGSFWVLINNANAAAFELLLRGTFLLRSTDTGKPKEVAEGTIGASPRFHVRGRITWFESFGVNCSDRFNRCSRCLLWCVKDENNFVFHREAVTRPSDRQEKYGDARAEPGGKLWDDVWGINPPIPRLTGTCKERILDFPTQLPLALLNPIVGCASDPGDLVIDPFSGSATTGVVAVTHGRRYLGVEKSEKFARLATLRLQGLTPE
jgi:site-specific DNA-methyltransferase (adenine-specific)